jgi:hypothetical protein
MTSEDSFRDRIEDELAALRPPPIGGIAGEALAHGRRIRRRERVFGMVGGTATVAGVAAGVVALSGGFASGGGGGSMPPGGAAGAAPTSRHAPTPTPTPTPSPTPTPNTPSSDLVAQSSPPTPGRSSTSSPNTVMGKSTRTSAGTSPMAPLVFTGGAILLRSVECVSLPDTVSE